MYQLYMGFLPEINVFVFVFVQCVCEFSFYCDQNFSSNRLHNPNDTVKQ